MTVLTDGRGMKVSEKGRQFAFRLYLYSSYYVHRVRAPPSHEGLGDLQGTRQRSCRAGSTEPAAKVIVVPSAAIVASRSASRANRRQQRYGNAKVPEQGAYCTTSAQERHSDCKERFDGMSLRIPPEILDQAFQLVHEVRYVALSWTPAVER